MMDNSQSFVKSDTLREGITDRCLVELYVMSLNVSSSSYSSRKFKEALKLTWRSKGGRPWRRHWILSIAGPVSKCKLT